MKSRIIFKSALAIAFTFLAAGARADDGREQFRQDLLKLSKPGAVLSCVNKLEPGFSDNFPEGFRRNQAYTLVVGSTGETGMKDAFMVEFHAGNQIEFSTLIAYEGFNGVVLGNITRTKNDRTVTQTHAFKGLFFIDITEVTENTDGLALTYKKETTHGKLVQTITCKPVK